MEQQYRINPDEMKRSKAAKPENRFWRIWGPVIIKWGISIAVSMVAAAIFEFVVIIKKTGADIGTAEGVAQIQAFMQQYLTSASSSMEFANEVSQEFMQYTTPVEGLAALVTIPIMLFMFHKDRVKEKLMGYVPNKKASIVKYSAIFVMMVALTVGVNNLLQLSGLMSSSEQYEETATALYAASLPMQLICLGILIPLCEELVFRGLMFRRMRQRGSFLQAALYTSFIFGFLHMNLVQMIYGFFLGMVFCYFYEKYGSVKAPVFAHMTANIVAVFMTHYGVMDWMQENPLIMCVVTVLCSTAASAMYVLIKRIDEKPERLENAGNAVG